MIGPLRPVELLARPMFAETCDDRWGHQRSCLQKADADLKPSVTQN